jgi:multicomponent Na+:H+ antiporter subunit E
MTESLPSVPRRRPGLRLVVVVVWSVVVWVALWGDISPANVLWGVVLGLLTVGLVPLTAPDRRVPVRPVALLRFAAFFLWALVRASAIVAWEVVTPRNDINEGIVAIPLRTSSPGLMTHIANVVSLTPGTLTLEVRRDPPTLYVHVLHLRAIEDVRADIHRLEDVVLAAFGPAADEGGDR